MELPDVILTAIFVVTNVLIGYAIHKIRKEL